MSWKLFIKLIAIWILATLIAIAVVEYNQARLNDPILYQIQSEDKIIDLNSGGLK